VKLVEIEESVKVFPGEYIYHEPTKQIVLCGSFSRKKDMIRVMANGSMFTDQIKNFRKINMQKKEHRTLKRARGCAGCKKK